MMKKSSLYQIGAVALVLAAGFFIYKQFVNGKKSQQPVSPEPIKDLDENPLNQVASTVGPRIENTLGALSGSLFGFLTEYNDYTVTTQTSGLNVRQKPDSKAKVVGNLPKGSTIKAKASGVKGWFDVSKDGSSNYGYVAAQFLKAIPKQK
jgi:uncharacterized protein YgiM (DUF1202 family)